jgi:hypothetical protein
MLRAAELTVWLSRSRFVSPQTFLQSLMHRPTHPSPATSTTFSCQLSKTLIAAPLLSFCAPGRPPTCEKPVLWGVRFEPRTPGLPDDEEEADVEDAMPLYLVEHVSLVLRNAIVSDSAGLYPINQ